LSDKAARWLKKK